MRCVESDGSLGAGLPPFVWSSSLVELFSLLAEPAAAPQTWRPDDASLGACRVPALLVSPCGEFRSAGSSPFVRS